MDKEFLVNVKFMIVGGYIFYVCCLLCIDKIEEELVKYLIFLEVVYVVYVEN